MSRREKIIAVILFCVVVFWAWRSLAKKTRRPEPPPRPSPVSGTALPERRDTQDPHALSVDDALARVSFGLNQEEPMIKNDPFRIFELKVEKRTGPLEYPDLVLSGIMRDKEEPVALINDEVVRVGDMVGDFRVEEIRDGNVALTREGKKYVLHLIQARKEP